MKGDEPPVAAGRVEFDILPPDVGMVTSPAALKLLEFLEASGGAPPEACSLLASRPRERFNSLRAAGFALRASLDGEELWLPREHGVRSPRDFARQRALGWFAARLTEARGRFSGNRAFFPNGREMPVAVLPFDSALPATAFVAVLARGGRPEDLPAGCFWCQEESLRRQMLRECLRKKS